MVRDVEFESLAPHRCGFESRQRHWILQSEEVIQLAYRTSVVLFICPLVPKIMHARLKSSATNESSTYDPFKVLVFVFFILKPDNGSKFQKINVWK